MRTMRILVALFALVVAVEAYAATFTVSDNGNGADLSAGDGTCDAGSGACTLTAAIQEANNLPGADTIVFSGPMTISPVSELPRAQSEITIDACTGIGADCAAGDLKVVISGSSSITYGISATADDVVIKGIRVTGVVDPMQDPALTPGFFADTGGTGSLTFQYCDSDGNGKGFALNADNVTVDHSWSRNNANEGVVIGTGDGTTLSYVYVGTNLAGTSAEPNGRGISVESDGSGGPTNVVLDHVLVSGNSAAGLNIKAGVIGATVSNSLFGLKADGVTDLCNVGDQLLDEGTSTTLTDNSIGCLATPTPTRTPTVAITNQGCCKFSGANDFGATCVDLPAMSDPGPMTLDLCNAVAGVVHEGSVLGFSDEHNCSTPGDVASECVLVSGPTNTPTPTATPRPPAASCVDPGDASLSWTSPTLEVDSRSLLSAPGLSYHLFVRSILVSSDGEASVTLSAGDVERVFSFSGAGTQLGDVMCLPPGEALVATREGSARVSFTIGYAVLPR